MTVLRKINLLLNMRYSETILWTLVFSILVLLSECSNTDPPDPVVCVLKNGECSPNDVNTTADHFECPTGYQLADNYSCTDMDECQIPGSCSQLCNNTEGSFECSCLEGYNTDPSNPRRCKAQSGHGALLYSNRMETRKIDLETYESTVVATNSPIELDYDFEDNLVIWGDVRQKSIYSAPVDNVGAITTIVNEDITELEGLAVDWIHNNVYWTDAGRDVICVASLDGERIKLLFQTGLDEPRAIVVNPLEGWMFWTDWGTAPKIERAGMDGTHRSTIISKNIAWPNGLTIDFVSKKIYWADAKINSIYSSDYDGLNKKLILKSYFHINHPFAVDVFEDWLYWTDRGSRSIMKANKFNGSDVEFVRSDLYKPTILRVYHSYKQPRGVNYCGQKNGECSYLCLPAPQIAPESSKYTCVCPSDQLVDCNATENITAVMTTNITETSSVPAIATIITDRPSMAAMTTIITETSSVPAMTTIITDRPSMATKTTNITDRPSMATKTTIITETSSVPAMTTIITDRPSMTAMTTIIPETSSVPAMTTIITDTPSTFVATTTSSVITPLENAQQSFLMNDTLRGNEEKSSDNGKIAGIIIGVLGCLILVISVVGFHIYKQHLRRNSTSMNFDNPVYRKTAVDQLHLVKNQYEPAMS